MRHSHSHTDDTMRRYTELNKSIDDTIDCIVKTVSTRLMMKTMSREFLSFINMLSIVDHILMVEEGDKSNQELYHMCLDDICKNMIQFFISCIPGLKDRLGDNSINGIDGMHIKT